MRTETLARQFDRVLAVLRDLGYVEDGRSPRRARRLTRIYGEGDLLVAEAIGARLFEGLEPAEVAALLSTVVYEARERVPLTGGMPTPSDGAERTSGSSRIWRQVRRTEDAHQVQLCRELEPGFATPVFHWARASRWRTSSPRPRWRPATSCATASSSSTCCGRSRRSLGPTSAALFARGRDRRCCAASSRTPGSEYDAAPMTSPFGHLAVIADPAGGDGRGGRAAPDLERALVAQRSAIPAAGRAARRRRRTWLASALDEGNRYVAAVGDDATVQDVVNGMFRDGSPIVDDRSSGWSPPARACDLMQSFGLPDDVEGAVGTSSGTTRIRSTS